MKRRSSRLGTEMANIELLRKKLEGWTWLDVCKSTAKSTNGIWFFGRIGLFLQRPCVAVCAMNSFVVLRYIPPEIWIDAFYLKYGEECYLDGSFERGMCLMEDHLPVLGLTPTGLVLSKEEK
jgi:hypothetical protein